MLSLVGSIQPDPLSPEHVPKAPWTIAASSFQQTNGPSQPPSDPFQSLGRLADDAEQCAKEAKEEGVQKEKKRKRKQGKGKDSAGVDASRKGRRRKRVSGYMRVVGFILQVVCLQVIAHYSP
ncbi:hypothetical protein C8Q74DRAFT_1258713 [Fomes fomentarius]|nr:hypothetical protein C8Q74DRAFT_1258713 [Fomes fomentarius]